MADDVTILAKFTPRAASRDGLLFAAGRASAPSRRPWIAATATLALLQVATLAAWHRPRTPPPMPVAAPPAFAPTPQEWQPPPPSSYLALRAHLGEPWRGPAVPDSEPPPGEPFGVRSSLE